MRAARWRWCLLCGIPAITLAGCEKRTGKSEDRLRLVSAFPSRMGGLARVTSEDHERKRPGLGNSVGYRDGEVSVTVYLYDSNIASIPDGASSDVVRQELDEVIDQIHGAKEIGLIESVKELSQKRVFLDSVGQRLETLSASFEIRERGEKLVTVAYLTGYRNHFLKVRMTYPRADQAKWETVVAGFLAELAGLLREHAEGE